MAEKIKNLPMRRIVVDPVRGPEAVHHFVWAMTGLEFLLEVGYVDFIEVHQKNLAVAKGEEVEPIDFVVTHRFSLSVDTVRKLAETVSKMVAAIPNAGEEERASSD